MKRTEEQIKYEELLVPFDVAHRKGDALWPAVVHIHDQPEIFYHVSGAQSFLINGAEYELDAGDLLVVRPLLPHCVKPVRDGVYERCVINVFPDLPELIGQLSQSEGWFHWLYHSGGEAPYKVHLDAGEHERYISLVDRYINLYKYRTQSIQVFHLYKLSTMLEILAFLSDIFSSKPHDELRRAGTESCCGRIFRYIEENYKRPFSLDELAGALSMNKTYLCRVFKQKTGSTINQYLIRRRVANVKRQLYSGREVREVFPESGFTDYCNFISTFTREVGVPPGRFYREGRWRSGEAAGKGFEGRTV